MHGLAVRGQAGEAGLVRRERKAMAGDVGSKIDMQGTGDGARPRHVAAAARAAGEAVLVDRGDVSRSHERFWIGGGVGQALETGTGVVVAQKIQRREGR